VPPQVLPQHRTVRLVASVVNDSLQTVQAHVLYPMLLVRLVCLLVVRATPSQVAMPARTLPHSRPNAAGTAALVGSVVSLASMR
jgi:hypothetical protein